LNRTALLLACAMSVAVLLPHGIAAAQSVGGPLMRCTVTVEMDGDRGQSLGSLFEVASEDGALTVGAGFCDVYNTRFRSGGRVVQFFVRSAGGAPEFELERLPRPSAGTGAYMFNVGDRLFATQADADGARVWDGVTGSWASIDGTALVRTPVGDGELAFGEGAFYHDGEVILSPPEVGSRQRHYYASGHLFFYHVNRGERSEYRPWVSDVDGWSKLYACPWDPAEGGSVDLSRAVVTTLPVVGETTFAWGQLDGLVLTCSNIGGVYVFDGERWRTIREPVLTESFQVYTMLRYYDRLLLGQYPTGEFFEFDGESLTRLEGWPLRIEGVSGSGRECQTAAIWGGRLLAGVWPWGELWSHDPDGNRWQPLGRLFSHPEPTAEFGHPYQPQCEQAGLVLNQYGQRVTSMVPLGDSLIISTSAKWPFEPDPPPDFMSAEQLAEYGSVWRLRVPGCVSAPIHPVSGRTTLEFTIAADEMRIAQNELLLASTPLSPEMAARLTGTAGWADPSWGEGVFGPFGGAAIEGACSAESRK
jgi:hypothetical protein